MVSTSLVDDTSVHTWLSRAGDRSKDMAKKSSVLYSDMHGLVIDKWVESWSLQLDVAWRSMLAIFSLSADGYTAAALLYDLYLLLPKSKS